MEVVLGGFVVLIGAGISRILELQGMECGIVHWMIGCFAGVLYMVISRY